MAKRKLTYEQAAERLEQIVERLENSNVTLDESVSLYKEGIEMAVFCRDKLNSAQKEVMELKKAFDGSFYLKPFDKNLEEQ